MIPRSSSQPVQLQTTIQQLSALNLEHQICHAAHDAKSLFSVLEQFATSNRRFILLNNQVDNIYGSDERIRAIGFQPGCYTPNAWFDSLIPYSTMNAGKYENVESMYCKFVVTNITTMHANPYPPVVPTSLGTAILAKINTHITDYTAMLDSVPITASFDIRNIISIFNYYQTNTSIMFDEAPLLRHLVFINLIQTIFSRERYDYPSQVLYYGTYTRIITIDWANSANTDDRGSMAPHHNSADMFLITATQYASILNGSFIPANRREYIMIPIKTCWTNTYWMYQYAMAFTTTAWWNYAVSVVVNSVNRKTGQLTGTEIRCLPESSTVYIPNSYFHITPHSTNLLFVLVDDASVAPMTSFFIGNVQIPAPNTQWTNPGDFSTALYTYLGRIGPAVFPAPIQLGHLNADACIALRYLMSTISVPGMLQRCMTMTSELCRARYMTNWVIPQPQPPVPTIVNTTPDQERYTDAVRMLFKDLFNDVGAAGKSPNSVIAEAEGTKTVGTTQNRGNNNHNNISDQRVHFVCSPTQPPGVDINVDVRTMKMEDNFLQRARALMVNLVPNIPVETPRYRVFTPMAAIEVEQSIGDYPLPFRQVTPAQILTYIQSVRISPYHVFPSSIVWIGSGPGHDIHIPQFSNSIVLSPQYSAMEASGPARFLLAINLFKHATLNDEIRFTDTRNLTLETTHFAPLIAALTEWNFAYFGLNIFDKNKMTDIYRNMKCTPVDNFWQTVTHGFILHNMTPHSRSSHAVYPDVIQLEQQFRNLLNLPSLELVDLHGGVLPWWFVCAVAEKFTKSKVIMPKEIPQEYIQGDDDWLGFVCSTHKSWYLFPFLTANNNYENPRFGWYPITYENRVGQQMYNPISWFPDMYYDETRRIQSFHMLMPSPSEVKWKVEILTQWIESSRWTPIHENRQNFVGYRAPASYIHESFIPTLQYGDLDHVVDIALDLNS